MVHPIREESSGAQLIEKILQFFRDAWQSILEARDYVRKEWYASK
jgi:hypothetical protein